MAETVCKYIQSAKRLGTVTDLPKSRGRERYENPGFYRYRRLRSSDYSAAPSIFASIWTEMPFFFIMS